MKKILIQMGHSGRTSGSTGAPEEMRWNEEIVPKMVQALKDKGFDTKSCVADPTDEEIAGDWDLFLAVHYDADVYDDRGGFIDTPDPSTDFATDESNRIASEMRKTYFSTTGIPEHMERSNANTKFYYMWSRLSQKTPCVILEAGVGYRTPEDHQTLWFQQDLVVKGVVDGIVNALGESEPVEPPENCEDEIERLKIDVEHLEEKVRELKYDLVKCESDLGECKESSGDEKKEFIKIGDTTLKVNGATIDGVNYAVEQPK